MKPTPPYRISRNISFSITIFVRASCWTTWDIRSSSKETTCLGSRAIAINQLLLFDLEDMGLY